VLPSRVMGSSTTAERRHLAATVPLILPSAAVNGLGLCICAFRGSIAHPAQSLCTLRDGRCLPPRNTRYRAPATAYSGRTLTGWTTPASPGALTVHLITVLRPPHSQSPRPVPNSVSHTRGALHRDALHSIECTVTEICIASLCDDLRGPARLQWRDAPRRPDARCRSAPVRLRQPRHRPGRSFLPRESDARARLRLRGRGRRWRRRDVTGGFRPRRPRISENGEFRDRCIKCRFAPPRGPSVSPKECGPAVHPTLFNALSPKYEIGSRRAMSARFPASAAWSGCVRYGCWLLPRADGKGSCLSRGYRAWPCC
jgi:hypothetical protein